MIGKILATGAGVLAGYFFGIRENLEAQSQIYLGNTLTGQQLFAYNDPAKNLIYNVVLFAVIAGGSYYATKKLVQLVENE
jgi:hypothetical protein